MCKADSSATELGARAPSTYSSLNPSVELPCDMAESLPDSGGSIRALRGSLEKIPRSCDSSTASPVLGSL